MGAADRGGRVLIMSSLFRPDVFISYASKDAIFVRKLAAALEAEGFHSFWAGAEDSIRPGEEWFRKILDALDKKGAGIIVLSPDSLESVFVNREIGVLLSQRRRQVIPLLYRDCRMDEVLAALQYIDFRDPAAWEEAFRKLVNILRKGRSRRMSLRRLFAAVLFAPIGLVLTISLLISGYRSYHFQQLKSTQREVQAIDEGLARIRRRPDLDSGKDGYLDERGRLVGANVWVADRLLWRELYAEGRLVARDEFFYPTAGKLPVSKERRYLAEDQSVFLIDKFAQDGRLLEKRACPDGPERPCDLYLDDMRSPMPPPSLFFYR